VPFWRPVSAAAGAMPLWTAVPSVGEVGAVTALRTTRTLALARSGQKLAAQVTSARCRMPWALRWK
jgi:hypothetical protein